jgi:hypothetical protein
MPDFIEEIITSAMQRGEFDNLPGAGKPLKLDDDPHTPDHLKLAHKLLKDNDLAPEWILQGKALEVDGETLITRIRGAWQRYQAQIAASQQHESPSLALARVTQTWESTQIDLHGAVLAFNKRVLTYNLSVPRGVTHRPLISLERELNAAKNA